MNNEKFAVTNHEYLNTGGNCMVSIFTVYDRAAKATRFVVCNDDGFNYQMIDNISNELPDDVDHDDIYIYSYDWSVLTSEPSFDQPQFTDEEFLLFKYCQFEFYKKYCKTFDRISLPVEWLPGEMHNELGPHAVEWHRDNRESVLTDGYDVFFSQQYIDYMDFNREEHGDDIKAVIDFKDWLNHITFTAEGDVNEALVDKKFTIVFNGRALELDFCAASFTGIVDALQYVIDQE